MRTAIWFSVVTIVTAAGWVLSNGWGALAFLVIGIFVATLFDLTDREHERVQELERRVGHLERDRTDA